jgi:hypothetical protein
LKTLEVPGVNRKENARLVEIPKLEEAAKICGVEGRSSRHSLPVCILIFNELK